MTARPLVSLLAACLLAAPARAFRGDGAARLRQAATLLARPGAGEGELAEALAALDAAAAQSLGEADQGRVDELRVEVYQRLLARRRGGPPGPRLEALQALERLQGREAASEDEWLAVLRALGRHQEAAARLEARWLDRSTPEGRRLRAGLELLALEHELAGGQPGPHLDAAAWVARELLPAMAASPEVGLAERAQAARLAGLVSLAQRRFEEAAERLGEADRAGALDPSDRRQLELARGFLRAAQRGEVTEASPYRHFTVQIGARVPFQEAELYRRLLDEARERIALALGFFPEGNLLVRVLLDRDYVRLLSPHTVAVTEEAGMVLRLSPGVTLEELRATVRHELTHHALAALAQPGKLPRWFHEGLAQCLEGEPMALDPYKRVLAAWRRRVLPDFAALAAFGARTRTVARLLYDASALEVRSFLDEQGEGAASRVARRVRAGVRFAEAFREETTRTPAEYFLRWRRGLLDQVRTRILEARQGGRPVEPDEQPGLWIQDGSGP